MNKHDYIEFLRVNGFNCFPIRAGVKAADSRYSGASTIPNQNITDLENYGYIPVLGRGTAIVDFDDEKFGEKLTEYAKSTMVIKTPHGYHLPVTGLQGMVDKVELFDYSKQDKKILEIQGPNHYGVGPESSVLLDNQGNNNEHPLYHNIGTDEILNVRGMDFHEFITKTCETFKVVSKMKNSGSFAHLRDKFAKGQPPGPGQSNDYFQQAALVCNTEGMSEEDATRKITAIYDVWSNSAAFSHRPLSNILAKISEVYSNDLKVHQGGHRPASKNKEDDIDIDLVVSDMLTRYKLYSDKTVGTIYEEINGFVKIVTTPLRYRIIRETSSDIHTTNEIMSKITANAENLPKTDPNIIVFKNGYYNILEHLFHEHDENHGLAVMGFENYDYQANPVCPKFEKFMRVTFPDDHMCEYAHTAASCCVVPEHQERITMCYGPAGTGKTTYREIISKCLGDYAKEVDNNSIFTDMFGLADWENKTFISLAEAPKSIKEFDKLKRITGESTLNIRQMHTSMKSVPNLTKIMMDTNNLFKIPEDEAGPMFDRLHLLEFTERFRYTNRDVKKLSSIIAEEEGEHVISMLLNLYDIDNAYPTPKETKSRWEDISIPEKNVFKILFEYKKDSPGLSPMDVKIIMEKHDIIDEVDMGIVRKIAKDVGYSMSNGVYTGLSQKINTSVLENY